MSVRVSVREFARRDDCNEKLVRRGIAEGRLTRGADGFLDAALVGTPWRRGNVGVADKPADIQAAVRTLSADATVGAPAPAPAAAVGSGARSQDPTYSQALAKKEHFLAERHELDFRLRRGELVEFEMARQVLFAETRRGRDHWLNWPARVAATIAADLGAEPDRVAEILTAHVLRHLDALAQPDGHELRPT